VREREMPEKKCVREKERIYATMRNMTSAEKRKEREGEGEIL